MWEGVWVSLHYSSSRSRPRPIRSRERHAVWRGWYGGMTTTLWRYSRNDYKVPERKSDGKTGYERVDEEEEEEVGD